MAMLCPALSAILAPASSPSPLRQYKSQQKEVIRLGSRHQKKSQSMAKIKGISRVSPQSGLQPATANTTPMPLATPKTNSHSKSIQKLKTIASKLKPAPISAFTTKKSLKIDNSPDRQRKTYMKLEYYEREGAETPVRALERGSAEEGQSVTSIWFRLEEGGHGHAGNVGSHDRHSSGVKIRQTHK